MKYWLLTTEYPPAHGGGISTYCFFTAQMLAAAGFSVSIFVNDDAVTGTDIKAGSLAVRVIRFNSNRDKLQDTLGYTARLSYAFASVVKEMIAQEGPPAIIEAQDYLGIAYYITQFKHAGYSFLSGVPILLTIHSPAFIYLLYNKVPVYRFPDFWTGEMEKQSIAAADALIFPTEFMLEEVEKHLPITDKQMAVIANPYRHNHPSVFSFRRNKIVYYGKLSPQKGSFQLLAYFKSLWEEGFPHPLHIIGGTDIVFYPEMKTMGQVLVAGYQEFVDKGLLVLHGKIPPEQIDAALLDAHVVIVPSIVDNMPYVVMEAMSRGKIVLVSVQGGQREMLEDGTNGFLFDHQVPGSFSSQLNKILALTDEEVQRIGVAACQKISVHYSFENILRQKNNFLLAVTTKHPAVNHFPFVQQREVHTLTTMAAEQGLLSVVIPFYNMTAYIDECIRSVNNSTFGNIEILVINDGSTDKQAVEKLQVLRGQKNVTVIDRLNHGLAETRNFGAAAARGEFLAFLDADDKVAPLYYEKAVMALQKNDNVYFAGCWVQYFENSSVVWPAFTPVPPYALVHNAVNSSSLVYKRNAFLTGGLNDKTVDYGLEDFESVIQMLSKGFNGIVLPEVLFYYRVRTGSMIRNITQAKSLYSNKYIADKHNAFYSAWHLPILHLLNANGPGYLYENPTFEVNVSVKTSRDSTLIAAMKSFIKKNETLKRMALKILQIRTKR